MRSVTLHNSTFYNGDCIIGAKKFIPDNSVDLIITDPPYGIHGDQLHRHYNRNESFVIDGYVEIPEPEYGEFSVRWIREAARILRPGGSIYIVSGYTNLYHILHALRQTDLQEVNHVIWKYPFGVFTRRKYISSHYHILFYEKPGGERTFNPESRFGLGEKSGFGRSLNNADREDVWLINREYKPGMAKNKNELPISLLTKMIQYSSSEEDRVCDLFLGGFSTAKAAIGLNRLAVGFEISGPVFTAKIPEIEAIVPGFLLSGLRTPAAGDPRNSRKPWTEEDRLLLETEYARLSGDGITKGEIIRQLGEALGRGHWAITKALAKKVRIRESDIGQKPVQG